MDVFNSDSPVDMRVAMFERNFLWHVAALVGMWAYALSVVYATKCPFGQTAFLGTFPVLAALRVRAASMLDQPEAFRRSAKLWLVSFQAIFALSVLDPSGSVEMAHAASRDAWVIKAFHIKLARLVFFIVLALKVVVVHTVVHTLFCLGFTVAYEVSYQLVNEYIDSRVQLAALTERNEQLVGEKERMDYERRMQRKQRNVPDTSGHDRNIVGALLGVMQDPDVTAAQQDCAKSVDHIVEKGLQTLGDDTRVSPSVETSPDAITVPLFLQYSDVQEADAWMQNTRLRPESEVSCVSSALLSIREAHKTAPLEWAPPPSNMQAPLFRRRRPDVDSVTPVQRLRRASRGI